MQRPNEALQKVAKDLGDQYKDWLIVVVDCEDNLIWNTSSNIAGVGLSQFVLDNLRSELQAPRRARGNG